MILKLSRNKIIIAFTTIVFIYFGLYNYKQLKNTKRVDGIIIEKYSLTNFEEAEKMQTYLDNSKIYNIIVYPSVSNNAIKAIAISSEENFIKGNKVPLRVSTVGNSNEIIYTFWSFWLTSIIISAIIILILLAFVLSFIDIHEIIILQLGKGGLRLSRNNKEQSKKELEKLEN